MKSNFSIILADVIWNIGAQKKLKKCSRDTSVASSFLVQFFFSLFKGDSVLDFFLDDFLNFLNSYSLEHQQTTNCKADNFFQGAGAKLCRTFVSKGTRIDQRTWCHATISSKRYTELGRKIRKIKIRWWENEREIERCYSGKWID